MSGTASPADAPHMWDDVALSPPSGASVLTASTPLVSFVVIPTAAQGIIVISSAPLVFFVVVPATEQGIIVISSTPLVFFVVVPATAP